MRCRRAQEWLTVADGLSPRRRRALDRHLGDCTSCRAEAAAGERLDALLATLPHEAAVPAALEQATLRAVRVMAADEAERESEPSWWRLGMPVPVFATAAVLLVAVGLYWRGTTAPPAGNVPSTASRGESRGVATAGRQTSVAAVDPKRGAASDATGGARRMDPNALAFDAPPPDLAAMPERFIDLPVIKNLDKLQHYEAITGVDDDLTDPGQAPQSDG